MVLPTLEHSHNSGKSDNERNIGVRVDAPGDDPGGEDQDAARAELDGQICLTSPVVDQQPGSSSVGLPAHIKQADGGETLRTDRRCSKQQNNKTKKINKNASHLGFILSHM